MIKNIPHTILISRKQDAYNEDFLNLKRKYSQYDEKNFSMR